MSLNDMAQVRQMRLLGLLEDQAEGFRLRKLEVYNWGTFDGKIWSYTPQGSTTLLTGDSGSGKSTLVDALATLLVSPRKIAYNKAADASARERSLTSYVRGYYGQKYAYEGKGQPEALRDAKQYTVLLATFADVALGKTITLALFLWFREQQGNPTRFYAVAKKELYIAKQFAGFRGDIRQLKASLRAADAEVFDDYKYYAECYRKALGDLSPQAIDLFQQTISMKKVEGLTDFVRSSMLEETDIAGEIEKLLEHYYSLNSAYEAVQRARRQTQLLDPICSNGKEYTKLLDELSELTRGEAVVELWFATLKQDLFIRQVSVLEDALEKAKSAIISEQGALDKLQTEIKRLEREIYENGGGVLEELQTELSRLKEALGRKQREVARYMTHAKVLELDEPISHTVFNKNLQRAKEWQKFLPQRTAVAEQQLTDISVKLENEKNVKRDMDDELESLKGRTSNIPKELIALRKRMCAALNIGEGLLPFAGELIEVTESEIKWEGAIERLLHSFALSVLVPEERYAAVAKWVNDQHLGARLVYFSTRPRPGTSPEVRPHTHTVAAKLSVKQNTPFTEWLTRELAERFDYVCCSDLDEFRREKRAVTLTGQIKSAMRHEKDDRRNLDDRTRYVLGFSNQKKMDLLKQKSAELAELIAGLQNNKEHANNISKSLDKQSNALTELTGFTDFLELDVQSAKRECLTCKQRIDQLTEKESNVLAVLRDRLAKAESKKKGQEERLKDANIAEHDLSERLAGVKQKQQLCIIKLQSETALEKTAYPYLEKKRARWLGNAVLTLDNSNEQETLYRNRLSSEKGKLHSAIAELRTGIEKGMQNFRYEFPMETRETDDTVSSLPDYRRMYDQLILDDLPRYEKEFRNLLTSRVINQIALFQMTLKQQYDKVKERVESINHSMHSIDYNPARYIKLNCEDNPDNEIRLFRNQLKACTEGASGGFDDENLATERFLQIKEIIMRFQGRDKEIEADKRWTKKVADVRNWFIFSASERWRKTDEEYEHFAHSDGKSGGQKEKLAYTVLAASLVYNYGLHEEYLERSVFRLVVIDEAFLRVSDNAAEYGLKLFEQLKFQLVIVTPLLKISTIEPFIAHVGFVSHDDVAHHSSLVNIPIEVYQEKRKAWEDLRHG